MSHKRYSQRAAWAGQQPISDLMHRALANPQLISLAAGFVDPVTLPTESTLAAFKEILSQPSTGQAALQYGTTPGYPPLRHGLLDRLVAADDAAAGVTNLSVDQIVVTAGSNQLLHLVCEAICDPGDIILCMAPTYFVMLGTIRGVGGRAMSVATDDQGPLPDALEETLRHLEAAEELHRVKALYLVSYFDNPRGLTMSSDRREQIMEIVLRWSRRSPFHVLEDAAYRDLHYDVDDVPSLRSLDVDGDTVVLAGTFSKSYSPGVRVGWGALPPRLVEPVCSLKGNMDFGSPNLSQHFIEQLMRDGVLDKHLESIRHSYAIKRDTMLAAAEKELAGLPGVHWIRPHGGLYVWLTLPEEIDAGPAGPLFDVALVQGVLYVPGEYCFPDEGVGVQKNTIRLSFGVQDCEGIRQGMQSLGRSLRSVL